MKINQGDTIYFRLPSDTTQYSAKIVSADRETLVLNADEHIPGISIGTIVIITTKEAGCCGKITGIDGRLIKLKSHCRREYFRIDDTLPLVVKKIEKLEESDEGHEKGRGLYNTDLPDMPTNQDLWKMLINMDAKINMILEKIRCKNDDINMAERKKVNISASGIRFTIRENINKGDKVEIKMLLPTNPQTELITYGEVVRVSDLGNGEHEVGIHFYDIKEDTREKIIQYTLERERELIRQKLMGK